MGLVLWTRLKGTMLIDFCSSFSLLEHAVSSEQMIFLHVLLLEMSLHRSMSKEHPILLS